MENFHHSLYTCLTDYQKTSWFMTQQSLRGFTLLSLLIAFLMISILSLFALNHYRSYIQEARLRQAQTALLDNHVFLSRFYAQHQRYTHNRNEWAELPIKQTEFFCIRLHGNPRGQADGYTLKAIAFEQDNEPRVLRINQDAQLSICESSINTCQDAGSFFVGKNPDKNCRIWQ